MAVDGANDELERTLRELAVLAKGGRPVEQTAENATAPCEPAPTASANAASNDTPDMTNPPHIGIDDALGKAWLELWYQPKIDLRQKCLAGAEALARINHPEHGLLWPESFLDDTDNALARLTEHALLTVLSDWEKFDQAGFNLRLAINLPVDHLLKLPILTLVDKHRPRAEHWPGLIVEVTEDQIVRDIKRARDVALQLKQSGIAVAIDDFGAGYSSFSTLGDLPFAELKINHGFVKDCAGEGTNAAICQTVIELAHRFGSSAVAEGIETMSDLQALQIMGCDFGQGVLLAPPMPRDRLIAMLQQRMANPRSAHAPATGAVAAAS
jgi:EAL domain-containing protein (putative c-di-GMP-specific phosphodiesterase class I)